MSRSLTITVAPDGAPTQDRVGIVTQAARRARRRSGLIDADEARLGGRVGTRPSLRSLVVRAAPEDLADEDVAEKAALASEFPSPAPP